MKKILATGFVLVTLGSFFASVSAHAQTAPEREITQVTGDLYRFREIRHVGMFLVTPDGIIVVDPTNPGLAGWLKTELDRRFGAPGDFAQAYVIAHEVGHHVQNLLGIARKVQNLRSRASARESNALSVRMELQADCLAGVWAQHANRARKLLEPGDLEEGLRAAAAVGDDTIQRRTQGHVVPESWTHGSAAQRVRWFRRGLERGRVEACDTFARAGGS